MPVRLTSLRWVFNDSRFTTSRQIANLSRIHDDSRKESGERANETGDDSLVVDRTANGLAVFHHRAGRLVQFQVTGAAAWEIR